MHLDKNTDLRQHIDVAGEKNIAIRGLTGTGKSFRAQQLVQGWDGPVVALGVEEAFEFPNTAEVVARLDTNQVTFNPRSAIFATVSAVAQYDPPLLIVADLKEWDKGLTSALVAVAGVGATLVATGQKLPDEIAEVADWVLETGTDFSVEFVNPN